MKKIISIMLTLLLLLSLAVTVYAEDESATIAFKAENELYAHAVSDSNDSQAWSAWQRRFAYDINEYVSEERYFFLPTSADSAKVDIYNAYSETASINGTEIPAGKTASVNYEAGKTYNVKVGEETYKCIFMNSNAEAAVYVNNSDADGKGTDLFTYLSEDKSLSAKAKGAIVTPDGKIDNTDIKKIKGRGNTTWAKSKKPFNITYSKNVSIAGMNEGKKYSLLANYQDDSLSRNRFLYDLSDAVGMPYASDSRYVDFYINGYYWGSYQMTEKVEVGKNSLISDFDEDDYLNEDGTVKEDFPFLCEVDAGATDGEDYYTKLSSGIKITIKAPELSEKDKGYNEVKNYVRDKFAAFFDASKSTSTKIADYADVDSIAKIYLINELGKNWDSGVSSLFFTYRQDENGKYKFFGSPVWDYDNSLGNATGVESELANIGVTDYEEYTGWWCKYKGRGSSRTSTNIMNRFSVNSIVLKRAKEIWFEKFVPAIDHFTGKEFNEEINKDFYTAEKYYSLIEKSAQMNYYSGWLLYTGKWIAPHSNLAKASFDSETNTYYINKYDTHYYTYSQRPTFTNMYDFCCDWMVSRAAWLSKEWSDKEVNVVTVNNGEDNPDNNSDNKGAVDNKNTGDKKTNSKTENKSAAKNVTSASKKAAEKPSLSPKKISLKAGKTKTLKVKNGKVKSWKTSKKSIAKVSKGKVIALKKGSATITAVLKNGKKLTCKVKVTTSPKLSKKTITVKLKKTKKIKIIGKAKGYKNKYKNTKVARVASKKTSKTLKIKGLKKGKTTLKITVNGVKLKLKVKVK